LVFALPPVLNVIPVSGLAGVMFMVVINTFEWKSLKMLLMSFIPLPQREKWFNKNTKIIRGDVFVMFMVTVVTLVTDLAIAVMVGIFISCLLYIWQQRIPRHTIAIEIDDSENSDNKEVKVYKIQAPLFFANCEDFASIFDAENDPDKVIVQFHEGEIADYSALHTLNNVAQQYAALGKTLLLEVSSPKSVKLVRKARHYLENIEVEYVEDFQLSTREEFCLDRGAEVSNAKQSKSSEHWEDMEPGTSRKSIEYDEIKIPLEVKSSTDSEVSAATGSEIELIPNSEDVNSLEAKI